MMQARWSGSALIAGVLVAACGAGGSADPGDPGTGRGEAESGAEGTSAASGPPQVTRLAYYAAADGPHMLFRGDDPGDGLTSLVVEFIGAAGAPAEVDLGDGESSELAVSALDASTGGVFFVDVHSAAGFDEQVAGIAATPRGAAGERGDRKTAFLSSPPVRELGKECDPQFDACAKDAVCAPGIVGATNRCASASAERAARCRAAAVLDPIVGPTSISGIARGESLFNPPPGCANPEAVGRPEGLAWLHVATKTGSITLTTAGPETSFDTVVYVLPGCDDATPAETSCNDDADDRPRTSKIVLRDVAPGDYLVVVDSIDRRGGAFGLNASVP